MQLQIKKNKKSKGEERRLQYSSTPSFPFEFLMQSSPIKKPISSSTQAFSSQQKPLSNNSVVSSHRTAQTTKPCLQIVTSPKSLINKSANQQTYYEKRQEIVQNNYEKDGNKYGQNYKNYCQITNNKKYFQNQNPNPKNKNGNIDNYPQPQSSKPSFQSQLASSSAANDNTLFGVIPSDLLGNCINPDQSSIKSLRKGNIMGKRDKKSTKVMDIDVDVDVVDVGVGASVCCQYSCQQEHEDDDYVNKNYNTDEYLNITKKVLFDRRAITQEDDRIQMKTMAIHNQQQQPSKSTKNYISLTSPSQPSKSTIKKGLFSSLAKNKKSGLGKQVNHDIINNDIDDDKWVIIDSNVSSHKNDNNDIDNDNDDDVDDDKKQRQQQYFNKINRPRKNVNKDSNKCNKNNKGLSNPLTPVHKGTVAPFAQRRLITLGQKPQMFNKRKSVSYCCNDDDDRGIIKTIISSRGNNNNNNSKNTNYCISGGQKRQQPQNYNIDFVEHYHREFQQKPQQQQHQASWFQPSKNSGSGSGPSSVSGPSSNFVQYSISYPSYICPLSGSKNSPTEPQHHEHQKIISLMTMPPLSQSQSQESKSHLCLRSPFTKKFGSIPHHCGFEEQPITQPLVKQFETPYTSSADNIEQVDRQNKNNSNCQQSKSKSDIENQKSPSPSSSLSQQLKTSQQKLFPSASSSQLQNTVKTVKITKNHNYHYNNNHTNNNNNNNHDDDVVQDNDNVDIYSPVTEPLDNKDEDNGLLQWQEQKQKSLNCLKKLVSDANTLSYQYIAVVGNINNSNHAHHYQYHKQDDNNQQQNKNKEKEKDIVKKALVIDQLINRNNGQNKDQNIQIRKYQPQNQPQPQSQNQVQNVDNQDQQILQMSLSFKKGQSFNCLQQQKQTFNKWNQIEIGTNFATAETFNNYHHHQQYQQQQQLQYLEHNVVDGLSSQLFQYQSQLPQHDDVSQGAATDVDCIIQDYENNPDSTSRNLRHTCTDAHVTTPAGYNFYKNKNNRQPLGQRALTIVSKYDGSSEPFRCSDLEQEESVILFQCSKQTDLNNKLMLLDKENGKDEIEQKDNQQEQEIIDQFPKKNSIMKQYITAYRGSYNGSEHIDDDKSESSRRVMIKKPILLDPNLLDNTDLSNNQESLLKNQNLFFWAREYVSLNCQLPSQQQQISQQQQAFNEHHQRLESPYFKNANNKGFINSQNDSQSKNESQVLSLKEQSNHGQPQPHPHTHHKFAQSEISVDQQLKSSFHHRNRVMSTQLLLLDSKNEKNESVKLPVEAVLMSKKKKVSQQRISSPKIYFNYEHLNNATEFTDDYDIQQDDSISQVMMLRHRKAHKEN